METSVSIREIMTRHPVTSPPEAPVVDIAKTMFTNHIGSVIISSNGGEEGIVTERDICYKVVAQGRDPSKTLARDIMSSKLVSISPEKSITDAAKLMVKKGIRRLAVVEEGKVVGIVTASDILAVSPKTIEVLRELYDIYSNEEPGAEPSDVMGGGGICDECGGVTDNLTPSNGRYLCDDCREEVEG
ncbi:MAG: CBS domain-containing protein [Methanobacteriota archaeon]|nr:MAG: CBS domain-containing protein [Euryarchaeota archaeon]